MSRFTKSAALVICAAVVIASAQQNALSEISAVKVCITHKVQYSI